MSQQQVLIVQDERDISAIVETYLQAADFSTHLMEQGRGVVEWVRLHQPAMVLLDLMLPGRDGLTLCREIRAFSSVPIIMITAKAEEVDRLVGLETGADDYLCKPFSVRELVARVKTVLRRSSAPAVPEEMLRLDAGRLRVYSSNGSHVELSAVEFGLFALMFKHPGRIYSRSQIIDLVYRDQHLVSERTVDSHVRNLRRKLDALGVGGDLIHAVYGAGYKFELPPDSQID